MGSEANLKPKRVLSGTRFLVRGIQMVNSLLLTIDDDDLENDDREERLGGVVERSLTVGWQSLHRVSMNHLVCPPTHSSY